MSMADFGFTQQQLARMDFGTIFTMACSWSGFDDEVRFSKTVKIPIQMITRWKSGGDEHYPSVQSMIKIRAALRTSHSGVADQPDGRDLLIAWEQAQEMEMDCLFRPRVKMSVDELRIIALQMAQEGGRVCGEVVDRLEDNDCSVADSKAILRKVRELNRKTGKLVSALMGCNDEVAA